MSKPSNVPSSVSKPKPGTELFTPQLSVPLSITAASVPPSDWDEPLASSLSSPLDSSSPESSLQAAPKMPATTRSASTGNARVRRSITGFSPCRFASAVSSTPALTLATGHPCWLSATVTLVTRHGPLWSFCVATRQRDALMSARSVNVRTWGAVWMTSSCGSGAHGAVEHLGDQGRDRTALGAGKGDVAEQRMALQRLDHRRDACV